MSKILFISKDLKNAEEKSVAYRKQENNIGLFCKDHQ